MNLKCEPNRACESGEMVEMLGRVTGTNIIQMMCIIKYKYYIKLTVVGT